MLVLDSRGAGGSCSLGTPGPVVAPRGRRSVIGILLRALDSARPGRGD
jgi:hypothetical protein